MIPAPTFPEPLGPYSPALWLQAIAVIFIGSLIGFVYYSFFSAGRARRGKPIWKPILICMITLIASTITAWAGSTIATNNYDQRQQANSDKLYQDEIAVLDQLASIHGIAFSQSAAVPTYPGMTWDEDVTSNDGTKMICTIFNKDGMIGLTCPESTTETPSN